MAHGQDYKLTTNQKDKSLKLLTQLAITLDKEIKFLY
jgi:hypothetical protein